MAIIYGINTEQEVTPLMVRDAILECFYRAHCEAAALGMASQEVNREYCSEIVKKAFIDSGADFENPSKKDILQAIDQLQSFSRNFRNPAIIEKHVTEIMQLVERLK